MIKTQEVGSRNLQTIQLFIKIIFMGEVLKAIGIFI